MFKRNNKFAHIKKINHAGIRFDSKLEMAVYNLIKLREIANEIKLIQCQDVIYLTDARIRYEPDFKCQDIKTGEFIWIEAKGYANERWPMKKKLWGHYGPGKLEIWQGTYQRPFLKETIFPRPQQTHCSHCLQPL